MSEYHMRCLDFLGVFSLCTHTTAIGAEETRGLLIALSSSIVSFLELGMSPSHFNAPTY